MRNGRRKHTDHRSSLVYIGAIECAGLLSALLALLVQFMLWNSSPPWNPNLPDVSHAMEQPDPERGTLVTLMAGESIHLDRQPVGAELALPSCQPAMRWDPVSGTSFLEADPELPYATVLAVLERCRALGGRNAVLLTARNVSVLEWWAYAASAKTP